MVSCETATLSFYFAKLNGEAKVVLAVDSAESPDSPGHPDTALKGLYSRRLLLWMQLGANLGQDTDPRLPFTETAGVWERIGGFSELILHPQ